MADYSLLIPFVTVAAILGLGWELGKLARRRTEQLKALAARSGLAFLEGGLRVDPLERSGLRVFSEGHSKDAVNVMQRLQYPGGELFFFDYSYLVGHGKSSTAYGYTLVFFRAAGEIFPEFELMPESLGDSFSELLGVRDIDFPGSPAFSGKYQLTGPDEPRIRELFKPNLLEWLALNPGFRVQARGRYLAACLKSGTLAAEDYRGFIARSDELVSFLLVSAGKYPPAAG